MRMWQKLKRLWLKNYGEVYKVLSFVGEDKNAARILKRMTSKENYVIVATYKIESGILYVLAQNIKKYKKSL